MAFRDVARVKKRISDDDCKDILRNENRGILSVIGDDGYPYGMPLNHFYNDEDGCLYFHSGKKGHRTDSILKCDKASYCVHDSGYREEGDWALTIRSVIVFGRIEIIDDKERIYEIARRLSHKFTDDEEYIEKEIERSGPATMMFLLRPEHITGKKVKEA